MSAAASFAAAAPGLVSAGRMQVIGLAPFKEQLGDRWPRAAARIVAFVEASIRAHLEPGDLCLPMGDLGFVITFGRLSPAEARVKCLAIATDVLRRLFGDDALDAQVRTVVGQVDGRLMTEEIDPHETLAAALEEAGEVVVYQRGADGSVVTAAEPRDAAPAPGSPGWASSAAERAAGPSKTSRYAPLRALEFDLKAARVSYSPCWDAKTNAILFYKGQVDGTACPREAPLKGAAGRRPLTPEETVAVERLALTRVSQAIEGLAAQGKRLLFSSPVSFASLVRQSDATPYLRQLANLPAEVRQLLVIEILGVGLGAPQMRLSELAGFIGRRCRSLICEVAPDDRHLERFASIGVHAVGFALKPQHETSQRAEFELFAERAQTARLAAQVSDVRSRSQVIAALAAGYRYISGPAVAAPAAEPDAAYRWSLKDFYARA